MPADPTDRPLAALDGAAPLLLSGGTILTAPASAPPAHALLIRDGRVAALDRDAQQQLAGQARNRPHDTARRTAIRTVPLGGRCVVPGFIDAHTHLLHLGLELTGVPIAGARDAGEVIERLRAALGGRPATNALIADGWDETRWPGAQPLTGAALDRLQTPVPVVLRRVCGHLAVANRAALAAVLRARPDWDHPQRGDRAGGVLLEDAAMQVRDVFPPSAAQVAEALARALRHAAALGITGMHDIGQPRGLQALSARRQRNALQARVVFHLSGTRQLARRVAMAAAAPPAPLARWDNDAWLRLGGIKLFLDGSLGARTAALAQPYRGGAPATRGQLLFTDAELAATVRSAHRQGLQVVLHAIGDRAIAQAIGALEPLGAAAVAAARHRLEHLELLPDPLLERLARCGATASMQPNFVHQWQAAGGLYAGVLGSERLRWMNRFGALRAAGVPLAFGSDCMPMGPLAGLEGAIHHPVATERLAPAAALAAYTAGAAAAAPAASGAPPLASGTLAAGDPADLVILDRNPLETTHPSAITVEATLAGGRVTYQREAAATAS